MQAFKNRFQALPDGVSRETHLRAMQYLHQNQCTSSAGLVIKAGASAVAKTGAAAIVAIADGVPVRIAAATDMTALAGTVVTATSNVFVFSVDKTGTLFTQMGVAGATTDLVKFPSIPEGRAVLGFVLVGNATGSDFVGGTTALDVGSLTTTYCNIVGPFFPVTAPL